MKKILFVILFMCISSISATTHYVPSEYTTIQAGIDAASEGDTVLVAPGTYTGNGNRDIDLSGLNVVILSEKGSDSTIIDIQASESEQYNGIMVYTGQDTSTVIDGFTFLNAYKTQFGTLQGGAVYVHNSGVTVRNCKFFSNRGGLYLNSNNSDTAKLIVSSCTFDDNTTAIYCSKQNVSTDNCIFTNNLQAIQLQQAGMDVSYSFFNGNEYSVYFCCLGVYPILIYHCTIVNSTIGVNLSQTPPKSSSGEYQVSADALPQISNSIIAYNDYGIISYFGPDMPTPYECTYSNLYSNSNFNWELGDFSDGDEFGNVSVDPLFCDTASGDFTLKSNSYCADGNNPSGSTIGVYDVGCEGGCCIGIRGDVTNDGNMDIADLVYYISWAFAGGPMFICPAEGDLNADGEYDVADIVYMVSYMFAGGPEPLPCP